jgi:hypothetical protein
MEEADPFTALLASRCAWVKLSMSVGEDSVGTHPCIAHKNCTVVFDVHAWRQCAPAYRPQRRWALLHVWQSQPPALVMHPPVIAALDSMPE